jgi:hypothetical protein
MKIIAMNKHQQHHTYKTIEAKFFREKRVHASQDNIIVF